MTRRARHAARKLLAIHSVEMPWVDPFGIAEDEGLDVRFETLEADTAGMFVRSARLPMSTIVINERDAKVRQRFTAAHELGHYLLHAGERVFVELRRNAVSSAGVRREEIEANAFAAELLMPGHMLRARVAEPLDPFDGDTELRQLAQTFKVSSQAMSYRLQNLGLLAQPAW